MKSKIQHHWHCLFRESISSDLATQPRSKAQSPANMMRRFLMLLVLGLASASASAATNQPNILLILADDAGYADFGFQGGGKDGDYANLTPNLDRLATNGVRFRNGYVSAPTGGPSRAGLLTGRYPQRYGFENNLRTNNAGLATNQLTIANHLKPLGYTNYAIGKWHLGTNAPYHPNVRGFDHFLGFTAGSRTYNQCTNCPPDERLQYNGTLLANDSEIYTTDNFACVATNYIGQHLANHSNSPFFMYLAFNGVHAPLEALPSDLSNPYVSAITNDLRRQTNAAMTLALDRAVGTVLSQLTNSGIHSNTLVVFLSDNGGPESDPARDTANGSDNGLLRDGKTSLYEGGIRVPFVMSWPGVFPTNDARKLIDDPVLALDLLPTFIAAGGGAVRPHLKLDGFNLLPRITNETIAPLQRCLFWRAQSDAGEQSAVRQGDWKFLRNTDGTPELYNLGTDIGEAANLAAAFPEKVAAFTATLSDWERGVIEPLWGFGAPGRSTPTLTFDASPLGYVVEKTDSGLGYMLSELRTPLSMSNDWTLIWRMSSKVVAGYGRNGYLVLSDGSNSANRIYAGLDVSGTFGSLSLFENQPPTSTNQTIGGPIRPEYYFRLDYKAAQHALRLRYGTNQPSILYAPASVSKILAGNYGPLRFAGFALQGPARTEFSSILTEPNPLAPPTSPSWTRLQMKREYRAGTNDANGVYMGGTEMNHLVGHKGKLYAGVGYWTDTNAPDVNPGAQVLVKDSTSAPWRVDKSFGTNFVRVESLRSFTFTTDKDGIPLEPPVNLLMAGVSFGDEHVESSTANVYIRNDTNGNWRFTSPGTNNSQAAVRCMFDHKDSVTGVHNVFATFGERRTHGTSKVVRGAYNRSTGLIDWDPEPELRGSERILSAGNLNGWAYVCIGTDGIPDNDIGGVFWREDGHNPVWHFAVEFEDHPENFDDVRGFGVVPHPQGFGYDVALVALNSHTKVMRIDPIGGDPRNGHLVTEELDIRTFLGDQWDNGTPITENIITAYNDMPELPDPATGRTNRFLGMFIKDFPAPTNTVEYNSTYYLIRRPDATYDWGRIVSAAEPIPQPFLRACRSACLSPFAGETNNVLFMGGYDGGGGGEGQNYAWHNTAWIYRGVLPDEKAGIETTNGMHLVNINTAFNWNYQLEGAPLLTNFFPVGLPLPGSNDARRAQVNSLLSSNDFYRWKISR